MIFDILLLCCSMPLFRLDRLLLLIYSSTLFNCFLLPVTAQTPIPPRSEPERLPPPQELLPPLSPPQQPITQPLEIPGEIVVRQFQVVGSTVFNASELAKVLQPFQNRSLSFNELLEAPRAIAALYVQKGYITSGAFIPPQVIDGDIVTIQVVEGKLESIEIVGLKRLSPNYVRSRIRVAAAPVLNQNRLLEALQLLQLDPIIANLSAELSAGSRPGQSILTIELTEAKARSVTARLDNLRSPAVGSFRRVVGFTHNNVLGFGDRFNFTFYNTDGSNTIDDLSYTVPVNAYNGKIDFKFRLASSKLIRPPAIPFDIISDFREYNLTYTQPILQSPNQEFILGLGLDRKETRSFVGDLPFRVLIDANDRGETNLSILQFFQEFTNRNSRQVFAARSQFNFGINDFNLDTNNNLANFQLPQSRFFSWRNQIQYLRLLNPNLLFLVRSDLQLADRPIFSLEKFSLGGLYTVRGYRQDLILADNGFATSAELRATLARFPSFDGSFQLIPFVDFGTAWNDPGSPIALDTTTLAAVGLGLSFNIGNNFTARIDWGQPLIEVTNFGNSLQENGIYFQFEYKTFF